MSSAISTTPAIAIAVAVLLLVATTTPAAAAPLKLPQKMSSSSSHYQSNKQKTSSSLDTSSSTVTSGSTSSSSWSVPVAGGQKFIFAVDGGKKSQVVLAGASVVDVVNTSSPGTLAYSQAEPHSSQPALPHGGTVCIDSGLFFYGGEDYFYARSLTTGDTMWKVAGLAKSFGPTCYEGVVYVVQSQTITALEATTGNTVWAKSGFDPKYWATSGVVASDNFLVYPTSTDGTVCIDRKTGSFKWKLYKSFPNQFGSAPVILIDEANDVVYTRANYSVTGTNVIFSISLTTGEANWGVYQLDVERPQSNIQVLATGKSSSSSSDHDAGHRFATKTSRTNVKNKNDNDDDGAVVTNSSSLYLFALNNTQVVAYDAGTGVQAWISAGSNYGSVLFNTGDSLVYASKGSTIDTLSPGSGVIVSTFTCVGGVKGIVNANGQVVCLGGNDAVQSIN